MPLAARSENGSRKSPKRARSSSCIGSMELELSTMNRMSTLFLMSCCVRTLVSCVTVVRGEATGGDRQAKSGTSASAARMCFAITRYWGGAKQSVTCGKTAAESAGGGVGGERAGIARVAHAVAVGVRLLAAVDGADGVEHLG